MEQTKIMNDAELSNEVMRAAGKPWHDVPADWPTTYRKFLKKFCRKWQQIWWY